MKTHYLSNAGGIPDPGIGLALENRGQDGKRILSVSKKVQSVIAISHVILGGFHMVASENQGSGKIIRKDQRGLMIHHRDHRTVSLKAHNEPQGKAFITIENVTRFKGILISCT